MLIDVRCQFCHNFLCQITKNLVGLVRLKCARCKRLNDISLSQVLKQIESDKLTLPTTVSTSA